VSKPVSILYIVVFLAILFGFAIAGMVLPDRAVSTVENRALSKLPAFSFEAVGTRRFFEEMNQYFNDQAPLRDEMVRLYQSQQNSGMFNSMLLENLFHVKPPQKPEEGTVVKDSRVVSNLVVINKKWIFPVTDPLVHTDKMDESTAKLNDAIQFAADQQTETYFVFNPSRTRTLMHLYPDYMQTDAYAKSKDYFLSKLAKSVNVVDIGKKFDAFTNAAKEELYLETDHHWNIQGAFAAYQEMIAEISAKSAQFEDKPMSLDDIRVSGLTIGSFEGSYNSQINYAVNPKTADRTVIYEPRKPFSFSKFEVINKDGTQTVKSFNDFYGFKRGQSTYAYGTIYGGDRRKIAYENPQANNRLNVLLLKDSFMNPLTPYLAQHFNKLTVYDNRYYSEFSLKEILASEHFDMLIIAFHDDNLFSGSYEFDKPL